MERKAKVRQQEAVDPNNDVVVERKQPVGREKPRPPVTREKHGDGMVDMARENVRMHLAPVPMASEPEAPPFPRAVLASAAGGAAIGALAGLIFGLLLVNGTVVIPGWEQLYSMTPGTFTVFWAGIGGALGLFLIGVLSLLIVSPRSESATAHRKRS